MKMPHRPRFPFLLRAPGRSAYTLVELLAVISIMTVIMLLVAPATQNINQAWTITNAGATLEGELTVARETALSRRQQVEVRFYKYAASGTTAWRAMQLFIQNDKGVFQPLNKMVQLPSGVIMNSGTTYSPLLSTASCTALASPPAIPVVGTSYTALLFRFLPNGQTNLPIDTIPSPFLTLHRDILTDPTKGNFYTIQIDPLNGKLKSYRP
jgi:uncharacterized protein (TIGR02596 family)